VNAENTKIAQAFPRLFERPSSYNIYHAFEEQSQYVVTQGYSGAMKRISKELFDWLQSGMRTDHLPSEGDYKWLREQYFLTRKTPLQEQKLVKQVLKAATERQSKDASIVVILNYDCDFRCRYCFERESVQLPRPRSSLSSLRTTTDRGILKTGMSDQVMNSAFEFIESKKVKEITLFGGEPFLPDETNQKITRSFIAGLKKRQITMSVVSNGANWQHYIDLFDPNFLTSIDVTIDGPKHIHDKRRIGPGKKQTFETIIQNIRKALDLGIKVHCRLNVDKTNVAEIHGLNNVFEENRFYKRKGQFVCYLANVTNSSIKNKKENFGPIEMYESAINQHLTQQECHDYSSGCSDSQPSFNIDYLPPEVGQICDALEGKKLLSRKFNFCSAYTGMYVLDPFGKIFSCWELVNLDTAYIGKFHPRVEMFYDKLHAWRGRSSEVTAKSCLECPYVLLHGSGCQAQSFRETGELWERDCQDFPEVFKFSLKTALRHCL